MKNTMDVISTGRKLGSKELKMHPYWKDRCMGSQMIIHLNIDSDSPALNKLVSTIESFSPVPTYTINLYRCDGSVEFSEENLSQEKAQKILSYWFILYKRTASLQYKKHEIVDMSFCQKQDEEDSSDSVEKDTQHSIPKLPMLTGLFKLNRDHSPRSPKSPNSPILFFGKTNTPRSGGNSSTESSPRKEGRSHGSSDSLPSLKKSGPLHSPKAKNFRVSFLNDLVAKKDEK